MKTGVPFGVTMWITPMVRRSKSRRGLGRCAVSGHRGRADPRGWRAGPVIVGHALLVRMGARLGLAPGVRENGRRGEQSS